MPRPNLRECATPNTDPAKRDLYELAVSRLRECFPAHWRQMVERSERVNAKRAPQTAVAESKAAASANTSVRCSERAWPFPALADGKCRGHYLDSKCEKSLLPSTTACAIANLDMICTL
jgi:hypothetical protein